MNTKKFTVLSLLLLILCGCTKDDTNSTLDGGVDKSANLKALGTSASDLLSDENFTSIRVEMVYVTGYEPSQRTLDNLESFLQNRSHKPDGISIVKRAVTSSAKAPFSIEEIVAIEDKERTAYNAGDEIAVYIYFADGNHQDQEQEDESSTVLGSAYRNTSIVIYGETLKRISSRIGASDKGIIESTVVNHEFGHLFGLVNLGTTLQSDHEDSTSDGHCTTYGCLMTANVQLRGISPGVSSNSIPELDELCLQDLLAKGGK